MYGGEVEGWGLLLPFVMLMYLFVLWGFIEERSIYFFALYDIWWILRMRWKWNLTNIWHQVKWWDDIRTLRSVTFLSLLDWCDIRTQDSSVQSEESTDLQIFIWKTYFAINHLFWQSQSGQVDFNYKEDGKCIGYIMRLKILIFSCFLVKSLKDKVQFILLQIQTLQFHKDLLTHQTKLFPVL